MKVYRSHKEIPFQKETSLTLGTFDGIHLGHQEILKALIRATDSGKGRSVLLTFSPHPQKVVGKDNKLCLLTTREEKQRVLGSLGLDVLLIRDFNREMADQPPRDFILELVKTVGVSRFIIGFNHAFGKDRTGGEKLLREIGGQCGFSVTVIPPVLFQGESVSSTRIRQKLQKGCIQEAASMLGRPYRLDGEVIPGHGLGRQIGFPTANIRVCDADKLIPGRGVYAIQVDHQGRIYSGMGYIGVRPTVSGHSEGIEVHIFDSDKELYRQKLGILFIHRIRSEKKFESVDRLQKQIYEDSIRVKQLLRSVKD